MVDRTIAQVDRLLDQPLATSAAVNDRREPERAAVETVMREQVLPAYARYRKALERYRPNARETIGISELPNGAALYQSRLRAWNSLDLAPQRIHEIGLEELDAITERAGGRSRRALVMARRRKPKAAARERDADDVARNDPRDRDKADRAGWKASTDWFGKLPVANCVVRPIDLAREADVLDHYVGPS